jgi:hypothetical protein
MTRSWLETIQLLGLDVVLGVILATLAVEGASWGLSRLGQALDRARRDRKRPEPESSQSPWPPQEWRPSH